MFKGEGVAGFLVAAVTAIAFMLVDDQAEAARGVFMDLDENIRIGLWRATTKGGCWTVRERELLRPEDR